jgi:hypothetical protein
MSKDILIMDRRFMMRVFPSVSLRVVLAAAVVTMVTSGIFWVVLASPLIKLLGGDPQQVSSQLPFSGLLVGFLGRIVIAYVLAVFLRYAGARGILTGVALACLACLGFAITLYIGEAAFGELPWPTIAVGSVQVLIDFAVMGAIIGWWAGKLSPAHEERVSERYAQSKA